MKTKDLLASAAVAAVVFVIMQKTGIASKL